MNLIDIASHQKGIDLNYIFDNNPIHGVIVKATGGTSYKNPEFKGWADWLSSNGKKYGFYHYCRELTGNPGTPEEEARYFFETVKPYIGKAAFAADFEDNNSDVFRKGTAWLKDFLDAFTALAGVKPLVYCSQSVTQMFNFSEIVRDGYQLWMAQYATTAPVYGFVDKPWHGGSIAPFLGFVMQQYTSLGQLEGWSSNLDLDKFYGTEEDWENMIRGVVPDVPEPEKLKKADPEIVMKVLNGDFGVRLERKKKLKEAGYDPTSVQDKINALYSVAAKIQPMIKTNREYIEPLIKIVDSM